MAEDRKNNQEGSGRPGWRHDLGPQTEMGDMLLSARSISRQMVARARDQAEQILSAAREQAAQIVREAEQEAAQIRHSAEAEAAVPSGQVSAEMQEYAIHCVEACMTRLRQHQIEAIDLINEQWQQFLCGVMLPGSEAPAAATLPESGEAQSGGEEISPDEIEQKVSAIAQELEDFSDSEE